VQRLGAYWAEVMGGPPVFSSEYSDHSSMLRMHAGNGDITDLGRRFLACFVQAQDDAGLPTDPEFRAALRDYMAWAVSDVLAYPDSHAAIPANLAMPRWSWDGLQSPNATV
jgi:hemoglobin